MNKAVRAAGVFMALQAVFLAGMCLVYLIPVEPMRENGRRSAEDLAQEPVYGDYLFHTGYPMLENWSEAIMLDMALTRDDTFMNGALNVPYHPAGADEFGGAQALARTAQGVEQPVESYARLWNGYLVALKPLLLLFDLRDIRYLCYLACVALLAADCLLLCRRLGLAAGASLLAAALFAYFPFHSACLIYAPDILNSLLALLLLLLAEGLPRFERWRPAFFLAVGAVTNFSSMIMFPYITLGLPLLYSLLLAQRQGVPARKAWVRMIWCVGAWGLGYGGTLAVKWLLAALLVEGSGGASKSMDYLALATPLGERIYTIWIKVTALLQPKLRGLSFLAGYGAWYLYSLRARSGRMPDPGYCAALLAVALSPAAWFLLIPGHSGHAVYPVFIFSVMAAALLVLPLQWMKKD